jgi:hypothetical protein
MSCKEYPNARCISISASLVLTIGHAVTKAQNHLERLQLKHDPSAFSVRCLSYYKSPATLHTTYICLWQKCMKVRLSATGLRHNKTLANSGRNISSHFQVLTHFTLELVITWLNLWREQSSEFEDAYPPFCLCWWIY